MPDLTDAMRRIRCFVAARRWQPFHDPKNLAMAVASEAGELCAELRWIASDDADAVVRDPRMHARLTDEAADVAITLLMFCDRAGIDLAAAIPEKLAKNARRYPVLLPGEPRDLSLMPWAARRALDLAGRKVSLEAWQAMPIEDRREVAAAGSADGVDVSRVREIVGEAPAIEPFDPPPTPPDALDDARHAWGELSAVARHALHAYAARGKHARLIETYEALTSSGASQSFR